METTQVSAEVLNAAFVDKLEQGHVKEAEEAGSRYIRQKLYEDGFTRRIIEPVTKTAEDLDPAVDSDTPRILVEKEPDAPGATFVPFKGTGNRAYFTGKRFNRFRSRKTACLLRLWTPTSLLIPLTFWLLQVQWGLKKLLLQVSRASPVCVCLWAQL
jgi:hypothetical protein